MSDASSRPYTTTDSGIPATSDEYSLTVGPDGPILLQDHYLVQKMQAFNRERVPERVVHAKGGGAHGFFETTEDVSQFTKALPFQKGKRTELFIRFSTVAGERGYADTVRDPRGFAIKFYTEHGNYDMADAMSKDYSTSRGEMIRTRLVNMTSDEAKLLAENSLHEQIALAGGFKAFHARANAQRKKNLNTLCEAGKIASWTLIAPSMVFGMMTGSAAIMAIFGGVFTPVVAAWIGTTVGLEGFATPWFLDEMLTGCYKNRN